MVRPSGFRSIPSSELNARPVAFTDFLRASSTPTASTHQSEYERLGHALIANSYSHPTQ